MNKTILREQEKTMYGAERFHILQYPGIRELFILGCIAADAYTLFTVFDILLTNDKNITKVITITVAAAINIIPMLLAACLWNRMLGRKMRKFLCVMLISLFSLLFLMTFGLRFTSRARLFESTSKLDVSARLQEETDPDDEPVKVTEEQDKATIDQDILAIILGLEPLVTSGIAFYLSYETSPHRKRKHINELCQIELREEIDNVKMMLHELTEDMKFDQEAYDSAQFDSMATQIRDLAEQDGIKARRLLAESEGTPEAVGYILEGGWRNDMQKEPGEDFVPIQTGADSDKWENMPGAHTA